MAKKKEDNELDELHHDPWPGYPDAFVVVCALCLVYLVLILLNTWGI